MVYADLGPVQGNLIEQPGELVAEVDVHPDIRLRVLLLGTALAAALLAGEADGLQFGKVVGIAQTVVVRCIDCDFAWCFEGR
eukprot:CAMPEP_0198498860 /NCGR_PEP_ID=MMETSP1462-20131121/7266_1 /TAXON_ID=1333877 /ORGANISM="Brandtodinium nutriculum, Strain RCC3387" /LENGTH=81 /DNA_ID=CAMNT_0044227807 /DNA_START=771 /DNA_END=1016 /DNA_ORIENTATION=-